MRRTTVDPRFAARLRTRMIETGLCGRELAARVPMSPGYLSEIVNGDKMPSQQIAQALDDALDAGGWLVDLIGIVCLTDDREHYHNAVEHPADLSPTLIDSFARVLSAQRHLEDSVGSTVMIGPVNAQLDVVTRMVASAHGQRRPAWMYVAAQWAQFAGWLYTAAGRWDDAVDWNRRALEWATEVDDPDLIATVLSYQGHVAWLRMQIGPSVGLAEAALRRPGVYPGQRAYDAFQAARGYAFTGDVDRALTLLTTADEMAEQTAAWGGEVPPWQYYREPWLWELERGLVWSEIGKHRLASGNSRATAAAVDHLKAGLDGMPESMRQCDWAAEYMIHLAVAYIRADATDAAREVLGDARRVAEATSAKRLLKLVASRERQLRR